MCGRYVSAKDRAALLAEFSAVAVDDYELKPDFNVAPSKKVYAVMQRSERQLRVVKWGLIPSWAKDPKIGSRLNNARLETAAEKPSFRTAYKKRRCLIPADGYYEWYTAEAPSSSGSSKSKPGKQPYFIHARDGGELAMAGLYEIWRNKTVADETQADAFIWTCTILTTTAADDLGRIHDRMPLLVTRSHWPDWLDPAQEVPPMDALIPAAPGLLEAYPVSSDVNSVRHNDPGLIRPVPLNS